MRKTINICNECGQEIKDTIVSFKGIIKESNEAIWEIGKNGLYWETSRDGRPFVGHYCNYTCLAKNLVKISKTNVLIKLAISEEKDTGYGVLGASSRFGETS